jgi:hypothetical protein
MSADDVRTFAEQLDRPHIPSPFDDPALSQAPEMLFVDRLKRAFSNIQTVEASFRDRGQLPTLATLSLLYNLILGRPSALDAVRDATETILRRPGSGIKDSDGGWVITLMEVRLNPPTILQNADYGLSLLFSEPLVHRIINNDPG